LLVFAAALPAVAAAAAAVAKAELVAAFCGCLACLQGTLQYNQQARARQT
jgi:hypothetical protein